MKNTINVEKLSRTDIDTDRLQTIALLLVKTLYVRADDDLNDTIDHGTATDESEKIDKARRDVLQGVYEALKAIPLRAEKWRHRLS